MKRVIVNADDYGLSPSVTRAILSAREAGIVTSTTVLANLCGSEDFGQLRASGLACGLHVNLVEGPPLSGTYGLETILDKRGHFAGIGRLAAVAVRGRLNAARVAEEVAAQAAMLADAGLVIYHMDSHQHAHHLPGIAEAVIGVMRRLGLRAVRLAREPALLPFGGVRPVLKKLALRPFVHFAGRRFREAGLRMPDRFIGIALLEPRNPAEALGWTIEHIPEGVTEVALHLALDEKPVQSHPYTQSWHRTFKAAMQMDWAQALSQSRAVPRDYGNAWSPTAAQEADISHARESFRES